MQSSHNSRIGRFLILRMFTINSFTSSSRGVHTGSAMLRDMFFVGACVLTNQKFVRISLNRGAIRQLDIKTKLIYVPLSEAEFVFIWNAEATNDSVMYIFNLLEAYIINKGEIFMDHIHTHGPHKYSAMYWTSHRAAIRALPPLAALSRIIKISVHHFLNFAHPITRINVFNVCNQHHTILNEQPAQYQV